MSPADTAFADPAAEQAPNAVGNPLARGGLLSPLRLNGDQIRDLISPLPHSQHLRRHRAALIISRVRLMAAFFAVMIPVWIVADYAAYPFPEWAQLAMARVGAAIVLLGIAWPWDMVRTRAAASALLVALLLVPPVFYVSSLLITDGYVPASGFPAILDHLYSLLPYTVVAGLCIFPLTALEVILLAVPVFAVTALGQSMQGAGLEEMVGNLWMLILITGASMISGMSQLHYIIALVNRATFDPLTNAYTRRTGAETLDLQFRLSTMQHQPLTLIFVDLDHFKSINDSFGHGAGDDALRDVAARIRSSLRRGDTLVRWGGEEFLAILPDSDASGAEIVARRILADGFGTRPDGSRLTASLGVAERLTDNVHDWPEFVALADDRMYQAKNGGRNRAQFWAGKVIEGEAV